MIPPTRLDDEVLDSARRADAQPRGAPRRPARPARRAPPRRAAHRRALRAPRARPTSSPRWTSCYDYSERRRPRRRSPPARTAATRRATSSRRSRATLDDPRGGHDRGRRDRDRLRRHRAAARRATSTARSRSTRSACYFVVRCLDRARPARLGRRVRAGHGQRARRLTRQRAPAGSGRRRATSRPRAASSTSSSRAFGERVPRSGAGPGDDEQRHARQRPLHVLRDDRRRPGRLPGRGRPVAACT